MREIPSENRPKLTRFADQNQPPKANGKTNSILAKTKSGTAWGSNIVKGFTTEKKTKQQFTIPNKKLPLTSSEVSNQKNQLISYHTRVKRSLIGDFPCSANVAQVHPHVLDCQRSKSSSSRDLFLELDHLRSLLRESKERELKLQAELQEYKGNLKSSDIERELDLKRSENDNLIRRIGFLEAEKTGLSERLGALSSIIEAIPREEGGNSTTDQSEEKMTSVLRNLEMEVVELRRVNKELHLQKRNLTTRLSSAESQLSTLAEVTESDMVAKVEAEASVLRHTNETLSKQVEGLQMSRLTEVEELVYLRWVNSCLRRELRNSAPSPVLDLDEPLSPRSQVAAKRQTFEYLSAKRNNEKDTNFSVSASAEFFGAKKMGLKKLMNWNETEDCHNLECKDLLDKEWLEAQQGRSPRRRHSISGSKGCSEDLIPSKRRQSDGFTCIKEIENEVLNDELCPAMKDIHLSNGQKYGLETLQSPRFSIERQETNKIMPLDVEKRALRIPNPPPKPSVLATEEPKKNVQAPVPPPPPPPPPPPLNLKSSNRSTNVMQRAPQVVEFYHSLMKRDSRRDSSGNGVCDASDVANVRSSMIGEIENRSSHLLAIKADVETQGEFVNLLIREVNGAVYRDIEDVVAFVKWLDDELCFLVDERAVLKHFNWPEKKADTLREAAFGYRDLKKLESEVSLYEDEPRLPCDAALKKMVALSEKMERSVYNLLRTRDGLMRHCKEFQIPTDWMLDTGLISKIKFGSVKLAKKYMKRVAMELQLMGASDKDPALEYMLLQGVRFAFRMHQFAGGFDAETMHAFEELRNLAHARDKRNRVK
ncbi:protein CHUP1, chloroplastic-like protein [Cinnamomum micranthum f. kanehirae]|uniref:Protein CHUP1, chloroplastic-like protein n=1 Tax=Cinnamomum micranthum f. kanehirae TaxID=337451 RepID=A0A3S3N047_9MAGN|nr:protein CHUP1, chloroplastic-like protein [Cinnamomum micranthum f. kanehirae]